MSDDAAAPVSVLPAAVRAAAVGAPGDLVCRPCGVLLMRASPAADRATSRYDTLVLCPSCGAKLRWRH